MTQTPSPFRSVERLSLLLMLLTYGLVVLGNMVRSTDSGLSYLTWPLYHGRVIPDREFHVLMEFSHRALAGAVSVLLLGLAALILRNPETRARLGGLAFASVGLLLAQILLGALTVWKLLAPVVVTGHLATAELLLVTLLLIHLSARRERGAPSAGVEPEPAGLRGLLALACALTYAQILLGGLVSSNHAGLAVPDFPTAQGAWFPPLEGLVGLQMLHRYGAYVLAVVLALTAARGSKSPQPRVRASALALLGMILLQILIGALNVLWRIPVWVTALHLAIATGMLAMCVATTFRLGLGRERSSPTGRLAVAR